jgi:hypothetical protein
MEIADPASFRRRFCDRGECRPSAKLGASPDRAYGGFAFYLLRGAASAMAWDLSHTPIKGIQTVIVTGAPISSAK